MKFGDNESLFKLLYHLEGITKQVIRANAFGIAFTRERVFWQC